VIVAPACGWESLSEKIASDAKFGGTNIRKLSFTNAEGCGHQIRQFLTDVVAIQLFDGPGRREAAGWHHPAPRRLALVVLLFAGNLKHLGWGQCFRSLSF
jgi:hypothetical protein